MSCFQDNYWELAWFRESKVMFQDNMNILTFFETKWKEISICEYLNATVW